MTIIEIPIGGHYPLAQLRAFCQHFDCSIKKSTGEYYFVAAEDARNLFWLGANLAGDLTESSLSKSVKSIYLTKPVKK